MRNIDLFMKHFAWAMDGQAAINALAGYLDQIVGPCPIDHGYVCIHDCKSCWKHYLESEVQDNESMKKAEIKLVIEDDAVTIESDNMDKVTMKDLVDCIQVLVRAVKRCGGTDLLIMASVVSGIGKED
jgi:hypothetical protein